LILGGLGYGVNGRRMPMIRGLGCEGWSGWEFDGLDRADGPRLEASTDAVEADGDFVPDNDDGGYALAAGEPLQLRDGLRMDGDIDLLELDALVRVVDLDGGGVGAIGVGVDDDFW